MNKQRKVLITITYNEMGIIIDTKAEELDSSEQPEIIRCKDCWHYPSEYADCPMIGWARNENDFCSKAERRTDEIN